MALLGIITCEILELEFASLLATDPDVTKVTVLEDQYSSRLIELLESKGVSSLERIPHMAGFHPIPSELLQVVVRVLDMSLHRSKTTLRRALKNGAMELARHVDALLLGYGLCGNALKHPQEFLDVDKPLFVPMDNVHPVDDCIGLLIGGRDCYLAEQCKVPGTFFMTPGWTRHWRRMFNGVDGNRDLEALKRLFARYERSLLIVTPGMGEDEMIQNTDEFNDLLGLRVESRPGTTDILDATWESAKTYLKGLANPSKSPFRPQRVLT